MALAEKKLNKIVVSITTDKPFLTSGFLKGHALPSGSNPSVFFSNTLKIFSSERTLSPTIFSDDNLNIIEDEINENINFLNHEFRELINNAVNLEKKDVDVAIDFIFETVNLLLKENKFDICKKLLDFIQVKTLSVDILLSFLTITLPASSILNQSRINFYNKVKNELKSREIEDYEGMLIGLGNEAF